MTGAPVTLLIGTRRGLFLARSDPGRRLWSLSEPVLVGREVYYATVDPRTGLAWAATRHPVWGAHLHVSRDGGGSWDVLPAVPHHAGERGIHAVWCVAPGPAGQPARLFAGIEPAGLFVSDDSGVSWAASTLNRHETTSTWQPAGGALALHSITVDPHDENRIFCAVSAGGVYRSLDGGHSWEPANRGTRAEFLPNPWPVAGQCVHKLLVHPARAGRLYQQNHCGTYRSDDGGDSWTDITAGLPSDFGYVLATDVRDADTLFVIPEDSSHMRTTAGGRLVVYRTRDGGRSWAALTSGLPAQNAWVSLLRDAMTNDSLDPAGIYFGTSGGHVFASIDAGETWRLIADYLPRVLSVGAAIMPA